MSKTLEQIKNDVAKKYGHSSWSAVKVKCLKDSIIGSSDMEAFMNEVCISFANQKLEEAAEKIPLGVLSYKRRQEAKQSILNLREEV